jgi:hypothetical protein
MDFAHRLRPAEIQEIVVAAHLAIPRVEARAAIALLVELQRLDHGAHRAVEHQDALAQSVRKRRTNRTHALTSALIGRSPSK